MSKIANSNFYDSYWIEKNTIENEITVGMKSVLSLIPKDSKSFLDTACGQGALLLELRRCGFKSIKGFDISTAPVKICRKKGLDVGLASLDDPLKFADNSFDCVICCNAFMHAFDAASALNELKRVSKKYVIIYVPNALYLTYRLNYLFGALPIFLSDKYSHTRVYSVKKLVALAKECGLKIKKKKFDGKFSPLSNSLFSSGFGFLLEK
jgi:methionine biosynthesis protein MetW